DGNREDPRLRTAELIERHVDPARARRLVEGDVPLEADAAVSADEVRTPLELLGRAVELQGAREHDVLDGGAELWLEKVEEQRVKASFETVRVIERKRAALPFEPFVHAEERDVVERQSLLVHPLREQPELAGRAERHDHRDLTALAPCRRDLLPDVVHECAM